MAVWSRLIRQLLPTLLFGILLLVAPIRMVAQTYPVQDPNEGNIADLDFITQGGRENTRKGIVRVDVELNFSLPEDPVFTCNTDSVGNTVLYTTDGAGAPQKIEVPANGSGNSVFPMTVQDKDGNLYRLEEETATDTDDQQSSSKKKLKTTKLGKQVKPITDKDLINKLNSDLK